MSVITVEGIYRDQLRDRLGKTVFDSGWRGNMIVLTCRQLLAGFMKGDESPLGIQSLKVGQGNPTWDTQSAPLPDPNAVSALVDTRPWAIPRAELQLRYLDASNQKSDAPTNRLEVVATLGPGQPPGADYPSPYPLREFGLFGQLGGAEYMIDYIRHPLIEKDSALTLERRVQLTF